MDYAATPEVVSIFRPTRPYRGIPYRLTGLENTRCLLQEEISIGPASGRRKASRMIRPLIKVRFARKPRRGNTKYSGMREGADCGLRRG